MGYSFMLDGGDCHEAADNMPMTPAMRRLRRVITTQRAGDRRGGEDSRTARPPRDPGDSDDSVVRGCAFLHRDGWNIRPAVVRLDKPGTVRGRHGAPSARAALAGRLQPSAMRTAQPSCGPPSLTSSARSPRGTWCSGKTSPATTADRRARRFVCPANAVRGCAEGGEVHPACRLPSRAARDLLEPYACPRGTAA